MKWLRAIMIVAALSLQVSIIANASDTKSDIDAFMQRNLLSQNQYNTLTNPEAPTASDDKPTKTLRPESLNDIPSFRLGKSDWSMTVPVFAGLVRAGFRQGKDGTGNSFTALSGIASGVKFRWQWDDTTSNHLRELLGFSLAAYYEPTITVKGADGKDGNYQALSACLALSTMEYFTLGFGVKVLSNEPGFRQNMDNDNLFVLIGLGVDGNSLVSQ